MRWLPVILILPYLILLLKIYRGLRKIKPFLVKKDPVTFVSVVVACRNEQANIPFLLDCLSMQDYPWELFEIIIVDDNSSDKTYETASGFSGPVKPITIYNKGIGKKQAIRTGIEKSSGNLIITTDADCRMGRNWIRTIAGFCEEHESDMIICPVQIESQTTFFGWFQELEFLSLQGITAGSAESKNSTMCNGANLAFTREAYINNMDNLHNEIASGDDIFLLQSLKKQTGSKISWLESSDSVVTTASAPSIGSFLKQRRRWISKGKAFNDKFTILLGIVTFVTILLFASVCAAAVINPGFIVVFLVIFLLKSVPDWLILQNTSVRYEKSKLMNWFLPAQLIYPFYVLCVVVFALVPHFRKELDPH